MSGRVSVDNERNSPHLHRHTWISSDDGGRRRDSHKSFVIGMGPSTCVNFPRVNVTEKSFAWDGPPLHAQGTVPGPPGT